jgi:uncharacterized membrane protein
MSPTCIINENFFVARIVVHARVCTSRYRLLYTATYRAAGHIPWWHQLEGNLLLIIIVVAVVIILVLILICVAIYIVCRRKHSEMKCKLLLIHHIVIDDRLLTRRFAWRRSQAGSRIPSGLTSMRRARLCEHLRKRLSYLAIMIGLEQNLSHKEACARVNGSANASIMKMRFRARPRRNSIGRLQTVPTVERLTRVIECTSCFHTID